MTERTITWWTNTTNKEERQFRIARTVVSTTAREVILAKDQSTQRALLFQNSDFVYLSKNDCSAYNIEVKL